MSKNTLTKILSIILFVVIGIMTALGIADSENRVKPLSNACEEVCQWCRDRHIELIGTNPTYTIVSTEYSICPQTQGMTAIVVGVYRCVNRHIFPCYFTTLKSIQTNPECE